MPEPALTRAGAGAGRPWISVARALTSMVTITAMLSAALLAPLPAGADPPPILHQVTYTVTSRDVVTADIYLRDVDPPSWADYSHNPYLFSPKIEAVVGPGRPWTQQVMLADPQQWAMVTATSGMRPISPQFHCELAVDGVLLASADGPKGALCSLRHR